MGPEFLLCSQSSSCITKFQRRHHLKTELVTVEGKTSSECVIFKTNQKLHRSRFLKGDAQFAVCFELYKDLRRFSLSKSSLETTRSASSKRHPGEKQSTGEETGKSQQRSAPWKKSMTNAPLQIHTFCKCRPSYRQNVDQNWSKCSETIFRKYSTVPSEASKHIAPTPRNFELVR